MKTYLLTEDQRNALLGYLVKRPYDEVAGGIEMLKALQEAPSSQPAPLAIVPEVPKES